MEKILSHFKKVEDHRHDYNDREKIALLCNYAPDLIQIDHTERLTFHSIAIRIENGPRFSAINRDFEIAANDVAREACQFLRQQISAISADSSPAMPPFSNFNSKITSTRKTFVTSSHSISPSSSPSISSVSTSVASPNFAVSCKIFDNRNTKQQPGKKSARNDRKRSKIFPLKITGNDKSKSNETKSALARVLAFRNETDKIETPVDIEKIKFIISAYKQVREDDKKVASDILEEINNICRPRRVIEMKMDFVSNPDFYITTVTVRGVAKFIAEADTRFESFGDATFKAFDFLRNLTRMIDHFKQLNNLQSSTITSTSFPSSPSSPSSSSDFGSPIPIVNILLNEYWHLLRFTATPSGASSDNNNCIRAFNGSNHVMMHTDHYDNLAGQSICATIQILPDINSFTGNGSSMREAKLAAAKQFLRYLTQFI